MNYLQQSTALFGSLKNAVLGNPVTREFTIGQQIASFGPGLHWKIFEGKKKSTGQDVSIFIFEKSCIEKFDRPVRELIFQKMRHGPQQLTKLRHPRILTVQHPLEESRDSLAFATEPVFASLSNVLGKHLNFTNGVPDGLKSFELYAVEKVYGLLQIAEGLSFLHNDANLNEGNVTAENIIITKGGQWKLAGFYFSQSKLNPVAGVEYSTRNPSVSRQDLNYLAPEWIFVQSDGGYSFDICKTDMFSFGCLINAVYNHLKTPFDAGDNIPAYKKSTEQLSRFGSDYLKNIPINVREHVKLLLNVSAETRPDAQATLSHPFFDDVAAMTLKYLDSLVQRDEITKSQFFKNLHHVLNKLPLRVLHQRILPPLFSEFPNHMMIPFVLPNVFAIGELSSKEDFNRLIFPEIKKIFNVVKPVEVLLIFMQRMELMLARCNKDDVKNFVLPLIFRALESPLLSIQELVLDIIPDIVHMIDYSSFKNAIIPRLKVVVTKTSSLPVCVNTLVCFGKIVEHLDKFLLVDDIFPVLTQIPSKDPAVLMGILGIYKQTISQKKFSLEKDYLACKAIPFLLPLAVEPTLNVKQFNNFMSVIRDMFDRVEQEHRNKLEQLQKMKDEQRSSIDFVKSASRSDPQDHMTDIMSKVDDLVVGKVDAKTTGKNIAADSEFSKMFGLHDEPSKQTKTTSNPNKSSISIQPNVSTNPSILQSGMKAKKKSIDNSSIISSQLMKNNLDSMSSSAAGNQSRGRASVLNSQSQSFNQPRYSQPKQSNEVNMSNFDSVLSPEMMNFKSRQQSVPMATLQQQQNSVTYPRTLLPTSIDQRSTNISSRTTMQIQNMPNQMFNSPNQNFIPQNQMFNSPNQNFIPPNQMNSMSQMNTNFNMSSNVIQPMNSALNANKTSNLSNEDINNLLL